MKLFPSLPLDSWTCDYCLWIKKYHISYSDLEHIHCHGESYPYPGRNCHLTGTITNSSEIHFTLLSSQLHRDNGEYGPIATLCLLLLSENSVVCNPVVVLAFCKSSWLFSHKHCIQGRQIYIQRKCLFQ